MTTISVLICRDCKKRTREEWYAPAGRTNTVYPACDTFVRYHRHLDGVCAKWAGIGDTPLTCPNCGGTHLSSGTITGRVTDTPCGDRCLTALGPTCDCQCGGDNHGRYAHGKD